jgi:hypothetical protein
MHCRIACAVFAGAFALISASAQAASFNDTYSGGDNFYNPNADNGTPGVKGDVIGNADWFDTTSMTVNRLGTSLQVVVHTNYAANPNALGTGFGALFLSTNTITVADSSTDRFTDHLGRFQYAFTMPFAPVFDSNGIATGNGSLFKLIGDGTDVQLSHNVPNGSNGTYGELGTSGNNFRNNQAVDHKGSNPAETGHDGSTWTVDKFNKTITFLITNENGLLGTDFALAWAMTCANDIILGNVSIPCDHCGPPPGQTPLPGAMALFAGGLGVLGMVGYRRRKRAIRV